MPKKKAPRRLARDTYNMGRPVTNKHKVPKKVWDTMTNRAKAVYNRFIDFTPTQTNLVPKGASLMTRKQWNDFRIGLAKRVARAVDQGRPR